MTNYRKCQKILNRVNGTNTLFEPVIKSIRDFLENIKEFDNSVGGGIIFFEKNHPQDSDLTMHVFPFMDNIEILNPLLELEDEKVYEILEKINTPKFYSQFWHKEQFKSKNNSENHGFASIPAENILNYNSKTIQYSIKIKEEILFKNSSWEEFFENFRKGFVQKHTYEQLLFESGCEQISFVPIPVLSTPSILLVLDQKYINRGKFSLYKSVYFRTRDAIDSYLYSRLFDSLELILENIVDNENGEEQLVKAFVEEICKIILPISYTINDHDEIFYYRDWPTEGIDSEYILPLMNGRYIVKFKLTSFFYPDLERNNSFDWSWIHKSKIYESNKKQSAILLCKLFNILHKNYLLTKRTKQLVKKEMLTLFSSFNFGGLQDTIAKINDEIKKISDSLIDYNPINRLDIQDDGKVFLYISGVKIISNQDRLGKDQQLGFNYLQHIIEKANSNNNKFSMTLTELVEYVHISKKQGKKGLKFDLDKIEKPSDDVFSKEETYIDKGYIAENTSSTDYLDSEEIKNQVRELCNHLKVYYNKYKEIIIDILRSQTMHKSESFNEGLIAMIMVYEGLKRRNLLKNLYFAIGEAAVSDFEDISIIYSKVNSENKTLFADFDKLRNKFYSNIKENKEKGKIRDAFRAMLSFLEAKKSKCNQEDDLFKSINKLLLNLEASGFKKLNKCEAIFHNNACSYNQRDNEFFIKWDR